MIPTSIHSNIAARPANFRFFLVSCFSFFSPLPLSFEDGERGGGVGTDGLLEDFVVWFCLCVKLHQLVYVSFQVYDS